MTYIITDHDKETFFKCSFNAQMSEIAGEVLRILRREKRVEKQNADTAVAKINRNEGSGRVINRMFQIIKADPKNRDVLYEVEAAERELWAFFAHEPGSKSEKEIYVYWNNYILAYSAELEASPEREC